ncbi:hypothetical protein EVAR_36096_1 [Eumeta japonica]|uniref:Uncharacterized protein n=1 Tax=Eumeta variegata TaxID=151549 RepID=A0A4C1YIL4_EUMVA|nr:hypothetical protein EVAR_36096_1 [Eumeta japonica]
MKEDGYPERRFAISPASAGRKDVLERRRAPARQTSNESVVSSSGVFVTPLLRQVCSRDLSILNGKGLVPRAMHAGLVRVGAADARRHRYGDDFRN